MENFDWSQFTKSITIKSDKSTVYNAGTKSEELEKWFLLNATFFNENNEKISPSMRVEADNK